MSLSIKIRAQQNSTSGIVLKAIISSLGDPWGGMIPIGCEGYFDRLSLTLTGYVPLLYRLDGTAYLNEKAKLQRDKKIKVEMRYYFNTDEDNSRLFIGLEYSYREQLYHIYEPSYYYSKYKEDVQFSSADVSRKRKNTGLYIGCQQKLYSRLSLDVYAGMGIKNYDIYHSNLTGESEIYDNGILKWRESHHDNEQRIGMYFPLGLSVCYRIR